MSFSCAKSPLAALPGIAGSKDYELEEDEPEEDDEED
jgi:hypothetical protein